MLGFTQPGSATTVPAGPSLDDLFNLPVTLPAGAANPFMWPWITPAPTSSAPAAQPAGAALTAWLQQNSTAVMVVAGALFALALFGGKRR